MGKKRPLGVTILAVLHLLAFLGLGLASLVMFGIGGMMFMTEVAELVVPSILTGVLASALGIFFGLASLLNVAMFWGLWKMTKWGWYLVEGWQILSVLSAIFSLFSVSLVALGSLVIHGIIVYYLWKKQSKFGVRVKF
jgi:hypothetical protein